jgi:hypothetical protein
MSQGPQGKRGKGAPLGLALPRGAAFAVGTAMAAAAAWVIVDRLRTPPVPRAAMDGAALDVGPLEVRPVTQASAWKATAARPSGADLDMGTAFAVAGSAGLCGADLERIPSWDRLLAGGEDASKSRPVLADADASGWP